MPFLRRRRIRRQTRNKGATPHSGTLISGSIGPGSAPVHQRICETEGGARTSTGTAQSIQSFRSTDETCNVGDLIKFINVFFECGPRLSDGAHRQQGWLEWVVLCGKESDTTIPIGQLGTTTLGVVANRMFPGQVLLSGFLPVGVNQPNFQEIKLKVPRKFQYLTLGDKIDVVYYFRTSNSVETGTDNTKVIMSYMYKSYN